MADYNDIERLLHGGDLRDLLGMHQRKEEMLSLGSSRNLLLEQVRAFQRDVFTGVRSSDGADDCHSLLEQVRAGFARTPEMDALERFRSLHSLDAEITDVKQRHDDTLALQQHLGIGFAPERFRATPAVPVWFPPSDVSTEELSARVEALEESDAEKDARIQDLEASDARKEARIQELEAELKSSTVEIWATPKNDREPS